MGYATYEQYLESKGLIEPPGLGEEGPLCITCTDVRMIQVSSIDFQCPTCGLDTMFY